jgi:predicted PurR-regulated permease PerM
MAMAAYAKSLISSTLTLLSPFFVAVIVAYIFHPIVSFLECRLKLSRLTGVVLTYSLILCLAAGFVAIIIPVLWKQITTLGTISAGFLTKLKAQGLKIFGDYEITGEEIRQALDYIQTRLEWDQVRSTAGTVATSAADATRMITNLVNSAVGGTIGFLVFMTFVIVITFYFLCDYSRVSPFLHKSLGREAEERFFYLWGKVDKSLGGYLRGQLTVAAIVGTLYGIGLMFLGMKGFAVLVGFTTGVGNLIPYVGPTVGAVMAIVWVIFTPEYPQLMDKVVGLGLVLALTALVQGLDGFVLHPKLVGKGAELHPLVILLALIIGAQFGLGGLILCVPVAIVIRVLVEELWWKPLLERRAKENIASHETPTGACDTSTKSN